MCPNKAPIYRPIHSTKAKPWTKSTNSPKRLSGRAAVTRRQHIAIRDQFRCYVCGCVTNNGQVDHVIPLSHGGGDDHKNLKWICINPCHTQKSVRDRLKKVGVGA